MIDFIINNWANIVLVIAFIIVVLLLYKYNKRETIRKIILSLVIQAEKTLGSGTGELKYAYVIDKYYNSMPSIIRFLYTDKDIDTFITESVAKLKDIIANGVNLSGYDDEIYLSTINKDNAE